MGRRLHALFLCNHGPLPCMSIGTAALSKYAANAFLATQISLIREMAGLCSRLKCR
jgi:UDP-glucose 6-dehydrogenase